MTEGEKKLREKLGDRRTQADVNDILAVLKTAHLFIHLGEFRQVTWDNVVDWQDTGVVYSIKVEYTDEEREEDE